MANNTPSDPLLRALMTIGRLNALPVDVAGAMRGLPTENGQLTPETFVAASHRIGLEAKIVRRGLKDIHPATLPVVLFLKDGSAAILTEWVNRKTVKVIAFTANEDLEIEVALSDVEKHYTGYAVLSHGAQQFEARADLSGDSAKPKHWFWSTLWKFRGVYARVAVATVCINFFALASSLFIMNVYDRVVPNKATDTLMMLALGVLIAYVMEFVLKTLRTIFIDRAGRRADLVLGSEVFAKVLATRYQNKPASAGTLAGQARSYESLREFFTSASVGALVDLPFIFFFVAIVYALAGVVALPLLAGVMLGLLIALVVQIPMNRAVDAGYRASNQRYAMMVESVNALETVKATGSESELQSRMEVCVRESAKADGKSRGISQTGMNLLALVQHLTTTLIVIVAYFQVAQEKLSMGAMIACVILAGRAMAPLNLFASLLMRLQQSRRSLKGLNEMMAAEDENGDNNKIAVSDFTPEIRVSNIKFGFGENPEEVLKSIDLNIAPGEKVALLGKIGCGKTTLLRLLMALYHSREGGIRISGVDTRQWSVGALRRHIGYVPQEPCLLYGSLRSNLLAGCHGQVDDDAIMRAIKRADIEEFVASLPEGLATPVSEGGSSLSGGQRQSIALARAYLLEPELMILDEPTSAMDTVTERKVLANLAEYLSEDPTRTLVVATHRRSMLSVADRVVVMDKGAVISDGPKENVLGPRGSNPNSPQPPRTRQQPAPATQQPIASAPAPANADRSCDQQASPIPDAASPSNIGLPS